MPCLLPVNHSYTECNFFTKEFVIGFEIHIILFVTEDENFDNLGGCISLYFDTMSGDIQQKRLTEGKAHVQAAEK